MQYLSEEEYGYASNLLEDTDITTAIEVLKSQIVESDDGYASSPIDNFSYILTALKNAENMDSIDGEDLAKIRKNVHIISLYVISSISEKFNFDIDEDWIENNEGKVPAIASGLYSFFILDYFYNQLNFLFNYIVKNKAELIEIFKDQNKNSTAATANVEYFGEEDAVLLNNTTSICIYIFDLMDDEVIFDYFSKSYLPGKIMESAYLENILNGDFVVVMRDIFKSNISLKSKVSFELVYKIKELNDITKGAKNNE